MLKSKHLIGLEHFPVSDLNKIIDTSFKFKDILQTESRKAILLKGKTIVNMFFENSTRTKISFSLAEKRLGADSINFSASTSSVKKGETLKDTVQNIESMKIDGAVIRHSHPGSASKLTEYIDGAVINAGDGSHEHPTQAILDMVTLKEKFGKITGLKVGIVGDILNSRVARSNIFALKKLGAKVVVCGPSTLLPSDAKKLGINITYNLNEVLNWCDAVIALRIQLERMHLGRIPSKREYHSEFGLTFERISKLKKDIVIMHPGPMNRGVEIDSRVADSDNAVILDQVLNGVASRMSILYLLLGEGNIKL